jgi:hypothetical protein
MSVDVPRAIEVLKTALLRDLGNEVDLIFRYGSHLSGATHKYSDLDISYVPVHASTWHNITVLLDGIMIDLYPIHWSQLEDMADFRNLSSTVLLKSEILYRRTEEAAQRFRALPARLRAWQQPEARTAMLQKAQEIFQGTGYPYLLLRQQAGQGHLLSCLHHARQILSTVLHCLMVCNQAVIDTRKKEQVLALSRLPAGFAETLERLTLACEPGELLAACETLLDTTRVLLLCEQRQGCSKDATFSTVFDKAYPELKGDLQHILLACERQDRFGLNVTSLLHELMFHMARVFDGIEFSGFNTIAEYEQDLAALGFPDLLKYAAAGDFAGLHRQCLAFDQHLQLFLAERSVALNAFSTVEELEKHLSQPPCS